MKIQRNIGNKGFTLVELMIVIVIIGVLAALASFGFMQYVKKSKTGEADELSRKMVDGAKTYFTTEQKYGGDEVWFSAGAAGTATGPGMPVAYSDKVFPGGVSVADIKTHASPPQGGTKAIPAFEGNNHQQVFKKLQFDVTDPTYFQYLYTTGAGYGNAATAVVTAVADFDASGDMDTNNNHTLRRNVSVNGNGEVVINPPVVTNEFQ